MVGLEPTVPFQGGYFSSVDMGVYPFGKGQMIINTLAAAASLRYPDRQ